MKTKRQQLALETMKILLSASSRYRRMTILDKFKFL